MFQFSPSQTSFVREGLLNHFRTDGRTATQKRSMNIKSNILDNLSGSSYVSIDHGKTEIYTGIKVKVSECREGSVAANTVTLEVSSMRRLTDELKDCLSYLQQLLQEHFVDREMAHFTRLAIPNSKRHFLEMHIQSFILSEPHLSLIEPLFYSLHSALASTSIPKLECYFNEVTNEESVELTNETQGLALNAVSGVVVVGCLQGKYILDLTPLEFESVDAAYLLAISPSQKVVGVQSLKGWVSGQELHKLCRFALSHQ